LREAAKRAANKAIELEPDLGEAHLAQGYSHYYCERDYDSAIASFKKAGQLLPNNSQIPQALGRAYRRKGEWQRSLEYYRQAIELDPGDASLRIDQANIFWNLRQFPAALKACDQILDIIPGNSQALATKAGIYQAQGNLPAAAALLSPLHPETNSSLYRTQIDQLIYERRYADAIAALKSALKDADPASSPVDYLEARLAWLQQLSGDATAARVTWQQVRSEAEDLSRRRNLSKPGRSLAEDFGVVPLASAYVALGDKAKAFAIVRQEQDVLASKDALVAARLPEVMAKLAVQAGEKDLALEQLAIAAQNPVSSSVTYGDLKLNPWWDPLRGDPRFEKIVASLAPKTN
jgi:serine/threonine-protein kinase